MKAFIRGLASLGFKFCLYFTAITAAIAITFGNPTKLKQALSQGNMYDSIVDSTLEEIKKQSQNQTQGQTTIPWEDGTIQAIAEEIFPPSLLQSLTEQVVDGTYRWLDGDVPQPDFRLDLTQVKANLANAIGDEAIRRVQRLPVCTIEQLRGMDLAHVQPFDMPCAPPGINLTSLKQEVVNTSAAELDPLKDPIITAEDLKDEQGQPIFQNASSVPHTFQRLGKLPWILGPLTLVFAAILIWLHNDKRRAFFVIARTALITGVLVLFSVLFSAFLLNRIEFNNGVQTAFQASALAAVKVIGDSLNRVLSTFGATYVVVGLGTLLGLHFTKPKRPAAAPLKSPTKQS